MRPDGINSAFTNFNGVNNVHKPDKTTSTSQTESTQSVSFKSDDDKVGRKDLDLQNPYGAMGLDIKKPASGTVEFFAQAAPELGKWHGNFALNDPKNAASTLNTYMYVLRDSKSVAEHLQKSQSPFSELYT